MTAGDPIVDHQFIPTEGEIVIQPPVGEIWMIKPENFYEYGVLLTDGLNEGLEIGSRKLFNFIPLNKQQSIITEKRSGGGMVLGQEELKLYIVHDFKNVPSHLSKEELLSVFKSMTNNHELIDAMGELPRAIARGFLRVLHLVMGLFVVDYQRIVGRLSTSHFVIGNVA